MCGEKGRRIMWAKELWFRAPALWSVPERVDFLKSLLSHSALAKFFYIFQRRLLWIESSSSDFASNYDFSLCQSQARLMIFDRWKLYKSRDMYGNATSWLHHAIQDCGTSISVQLDFKLEHLLSGTCPSRHLSLVALHGIPIVLPLNHFDLRVARAKFGPTTSRTEYFATAIPWIFMGSNMISGSALVHSLPAPRCKHMDCLAQFQPQDIETRWPRILHINPDTGSQPTLPITRAFTVSDGSGRSVGYRMVGTMSFDSERQHYTAKIMIDNQSFSYDGLCRGGALVPLGSLDMMFLPDPCAVMWLYHRTSTAHTVSNLLLSPSMKYLPVIFPIRRPGVMVVDNPQLAGMKQSVLHCADCRSVHHLKCAMEVNPDLDLETEWYCNVCFTPKPVAWSDDLLGKYLMCQTNPCSSFYPARVAGTTSAGMNNVGTIKWPPRLQEDAAQLYCFDNPEISAALTQSRQRIIDIILANDNTVHPIISDYHEWMLDAPQSKETQSDQFFIAQFSPNLLYLECM
ncbi:hypothetical protein B0H14DRAFT_2592550 [Mycena olivaceomarginata]|nr:hypothetical protein B0H14DRAFT_2592550 [Mycena olivaceomarginata]